MNDSLKDAARKALPLGLVDGNAGKIFEPGQRRCNLVALAFVGTLVILKIVDLLVGVRVSEEQEVEGLDLSMHGEEGYNLEG